MIKRKKYLVGGTLVFLLISYISFNYFLNTIGEAFGTKCEVYRTWNIDNYEIRQLSCIGWAGPHYYPADLYENGELIESSSFVKDSCYLEFQPKQDSFLRFNICEAEAKLNKIDIISNQKRNELGIPILPEEYEKHKYLWINPDDSSLTRHQWKDITKQSETDSYLRKDLSGTREELQISYNFKHLEYNVTPWYCQLLSFDQNGIIMTNTELTLEQADSVLAKWNMHRVKK
ncbi:MAG: hypothetical protein AAFN93_17815 [Bacteroidota bacterium]